MGKCRFNDDGLCEVHDTIEENHPVSGSAWRGLCHIAAAELERQRKANESTMICYQAQIDELEHALAEAHGVAQALEWRVEEAERHVRAMQETKSGEVATLESRLAHLEEEKTTLVQTIEVTQAHRKTAPHGNCECQVCYLYRRIVQLEAQLDNLNPLR